ncbi:MAG TPA: sensor histidine kinase [Magnetospirillum sp.]|nr:sensor histidine kinase [Magnetospirillum sp.]
MVRTFRARGIALLAVMMIAVATCIQLAVAKGREEQNARQLIDSMTQTVARHMASTLTSADTLLLDVTDMITEGRWDEGTSRERLSARLLSMPEILYVGAVDTEGRMRPNTLPSVGMHSEGLNISDRDYVGSASRDGIGPQVVRGMIGRLTGKRSIPLARPVFDSTRRRVATAVVVIDADYYAETLAANVVDPDGGAALIRLDGTILARSPAHGEKFGTSIADSDLLTKWIPQSSSGVARLVSKADGNDKFVGYRVLPNFDLVITSAMSVTRAFQAWYQMASIEIAAVAVLSGLLFQWGWLTDRRESQLLSHQDELERAVSERTRLLESTTALAERRAARILATHAVLTRLAQVAAHQLQEPVRPIVSFTQLARRNLPVGAVEAHEYLEYVEASGIRLKSVLVAFQRYVELLGRTPVPEVLDLEGMVDTLVLESSSEFASVGGTLARGPLLQVVADRAMLHSALRELISNAIQARHPHRPLQVTISAEALEHGWRISVADNGRGVDAAVRPRLFEAFVRHHRDAPGAIGLGLAVCRAVAEAHGGRIVLTTSDEGTCFSLELGDLRSDVQG